MDSIHRKDTATFKGLGQQFCTLRNLQILIRQRQCGLYFATSSIIRDSIDFVMECFRTQQRNITGLHRRQNCQNCFRVVSDRQTDVENNNSRDKFACQIVISTVSSMQRISAHGLSQQP